MNEKTIADEREPKAAIDADERDGESSVEGSVRGQAAVATTGPRRGRPLVIALTAAVLALATAVVVLAVLFAGDRGELRDLRAETERSEHAQQVALEYATAAAQMDYQDLAGWNENLVAGTSPELTEKLKTAASSMEQVIVPLQWTSSAQPIAAQVVENNGEVYTVAAFVNVNTKNAESPEGVQSTATYTVTLDRAKDWLITDVGGVNPVGQK